VPSTSTEIALRDVAQHPWHDSPAPKCFGIRAHRVLAPGATKDVGPRSDILESLGDQALELSDRDRVLGLFASHPAQEDLGLIARKRRAVGGVLHLPQPITSD